MPKLTFETFVAALAVAGASACSKAAPAQAEPVQAAPPPPAATTMPEPDKDDAIATVDAGVELKRPATRAVAPPSKAPQKNVQAGCGAGACSDDMKKK